MKMGQAFRRASTKLRNTNIDTSSSSSSRLRHPSFDPVKPPPPPPPPPHDNIHLRPNDTEAGSKSNASLPEEKDPKFEAMLNQMVGRISTKPGGKPEMGEAFVVQKSNRPLPKVRNTGGSERYEEKPVAVGTLNVAQLSHICRLLEGKADDHDGPMALKDIAHKFRVDDVQLETIFKYVSLPPEDNTSKRRQEM